LWGTNAMSINKSQRGFSLVEILVVMVMMGVVTTAIMSLYINTQRQSSTSEEIVDLQQNVRIAMNEMVLDFRMAGLLVPVDLTTIANAPATPVEDGNNDCLSGGTDNCFVFRTAAASRRVGRIGDSTTYTVTTSTGAPRSVTMANAAMARNFNPGDRVRIVMPADLDQRVDEIFEVDVDGGVDTEVVLKAVTNVATYSSGETMVQVDAGSPFPQQVSYFLASNQLRRQVNSGVPTVVADGITGLQLTYLLSDGTSVSTVPADMLGDVTTVRIAIAGQTNTPKGVKSRDLSTEVKIRN
jgi:prepilin-type N-terminal cleavage/methylation domain-containing protein